MEGKNPLARPWYEWIGWLVWLAAVVIIFQTALASHVELEPRAATINWIIFIVLLAFAGIVWGIRLARKG